MNSTVLWLSWRIQQNRWAELSFLKRVLSLALIILWFGVWAILGWTTAVLITSLDTAEEHLAWLGGIFVLLSLYWQFLPLFSPLRGGLPETWRLRIFPLSNLELFILELVQRLVASIETIIFLGAFWLIYSNYTIGSWIFSFLVLTWFAALNVIVSILVTAALKAVFRSGTLLILITLLAIALFVVWWNTSADQGLEGIVPVGLWIYISPLNLAFLLVDGMQWLPILSASLWSLMAMLAAYYSFCWHIRNVDRFESWILAGGPKRGVQPLLSPVCWLPGRLWSLFIKECLQWSRSSRLRLLVFNALILGGLLLPWLLSRLNIYDPGLVVLLCGLYAAMVVSESTAWNLFGLDGKATGFYLLAPIPFHQVLAIKALAAGVILFWVAILVAILSQLLLGGIDIGQLALVARSGLLFVVYLVALSCPFSVRYGCPVPQSSFQPAPLPFAARIVAMVLASLAFAPVALDRWITSKTSSAVLQFSTVLILLGTGFLVLYIALGLTARSLEAKRDEFAGKFLQQIEE